MTLLFLLALLLGIVHVQAVDYPGGWMPNSQQCVDICVGVPPSPICPTRDPECLRKKQQPGDYDFLVLEQLFLPQFCRDLLAGVDLTISHRNVNKYPNGIVCEPSKATSKLSIHGLWPNYNAGFSACCNVSDTIRNQPYDALGFATESPELLAEMDEVWVDPTQPSSFRTLCELYNHEFQKHGLCYAANGGTDFGRSARGYFHAVLRAASVNRDATEAINDWAISSSPKTTLGAVMALYTTRVQVLCSAIASVDESSDKTPVWNEVFVFSIVDPQLDQLIVEVKDKNFTASTLIGECRLPVSMFFNGSVVDQWYTLNNGSKRAGEINLRVQFKGQGVQPGAAVTMVSTGKMSKHSSAQAYPYSYPQQSAAHGYPAPQQYPASSVTTAAVAAVAATSAPAYPPQQPYYQQPPPQYAQPPPPQPYYQHPPPPPAYGYPPPPPTTVAYAAGPPVMVMQGGPSPYDHHHHHHGHGSYRGGSGFGGFGGGRRSGGSGMSGGQMAMGVGAGLLGGLLLGEALD
ncbi:hypothetical protein BBJ29_005625 [Phytophthora kernoviae]|uniref:C2 domain-containing protein n=1 Tax=Phytophthora kernoviae TaxID=325452 RepID=A0A3F2RYM1_9STRA|nr:hypothetical protein BBJ29_005625 [Phytophthora kernoviae]RLN65919.1 hypothetical protein BBP00_00002553 [Phytophthora kernoviae]